MTRTPVLAIHLGGTTCSVGLWLDDEQLPQIISNERGTRTMPAYVAYTDSGVLVGQDAVDQQRDNPKNTIYALTTLLGRNYDSPAVQRGMKEWPFKVISKENKPYIEVEVNGKQTHLMAEEVIAVLFTKLRGIAESYQGGSVGRGVVTAPDLLNNDMAKAGLKFACTQAGISSVRIVHESLAMMLGHGLDGLRSPTYEEDYALCISHGRTALDIAAVCIDDGVFETKASHRSNVAGAVLDAALAAHFAKEFSVTLGRDLTNDADAMQRLANACERAKIELSSATEATVYLYVEGDVLEGSLTRKCFEELITDHRASMQQSILTTLAAAGWTSDKLHRVVLSGGGASMPWVAQLLSAIFPNAFLHLRTPVVHSPEEAPVIGAVYQAASVCLLKLRDRATVCELVFLDVVPLSVGVELDGGLMHVAVPRNTAMPCRKQLCFSTSRDWQTQVSFNICSGERVLAKDNILRQVVNLDSLPALPKGDLVIQIEFSFEADGRLTVATFMYCSLNFQHYQVLYSGKLDLSQQQIEENITQARREEDNPDAPEAAKKACNELLAAVDRVKSGVESEDVRQSSWTDAERAAVLAAIAETHEWLWSNASVLHPRSVYVNRLADFQRGTMELISMNAHALRLRR